MRPLNLQHQEAAIYDRWLARCERDSEVVDIRSPVSPVNDPGRPNREQREYEGSPPPDPTSDLVGTLEIEVDRAHLGRSDNISISPEDLLKYDDFIRLHCVLILGHSYPHLVRDAVQDTYHKALNSIGKGCEVRSPRPWLAKIARNAALNTRRKEAMYRKHHDPCDLAETDCPDPRSEVSGLFLLLSELNSHLSLTQLVILRSILDGQLKKDIAAKLGLAPSAVTYHVGRIRAVISMILNSDPDPDPLSPRSKKQDGENRTMAQSKIRASQIPALKRLLLKLPAFREYDGLPVRPDVRSLEDILRILQSEEGAARSRPDVTPNLNEGGLGAPCDTRIAINAPYTADSDGKDTRRKNFSGNCRHFVSAPSLVRGRGREREYVSASECSGQTLPALAERFSEETDPTTLWKHHATSALLHNSYRASGYLVDCEVVSGDSSSFPSAGLFALHATSASTKGTRPRVAYLGETCTADPAGHRDSVIRETPIDLLVRITEPGTHYLSVSPEDPELPLACYRLVSAFAPEPVVPNEGVALGADPPESCTADELPTVSSEPFSEDRFVELFRDPGLTTKEVDPVQCDVVSGGSSSSGVVLIESDDPLQVTLFEGTDCQAEERRAEGLLGGDGSFVAAPVFPGEYRLDLQTARNASYTVGVKYYALCDLNASDDHLDTPMCASVLEAGQGVGGTIGGPAGEDEDFFTFTVGAQERVRLAVRSEERVAVKLFDEAGQQLAVWDACRAGCAGRLVRTLGRGRYFLSVGSAEASGGRYRVILGR